MASEVATRKNPDVSWRSIEGQAVLVHNRLGEIMVLNEVGTFIWERMEDHPLDLAAAVAGEFAVDPEVARKDLEDFVKELLESGALLPAD
jgi:hypothetical protein